MGNYNEILQKTKELYNGLYANDVNSFCAVPEYLGKCASIFKEFIDDGAECSESMINAYNKAAACYRAQTVIGLADALKYDMERIFQSANGDETKNVCIDNKVISSDNLKRNLDSIESNRDDIYKKFYDINIDSVEKDEKLVIDINGTMAMNTDDGLIYLNSQYDREYAASKWVDSLEEIKYNNVVFICGIADFSYIRELLKRISEDTSVIVYEPNKEVFEADIIYTDISDILTKKNVLIIVKGLNDEYIWDSIGLTTNYINIEQLKIFSSPAYDVINYDEIKEYEEECKRCLVSMQINNNTIMLKNRFTSYNIIMNLQIVKNSTDIMRVRDIFAEYGVCDNVPAIVIAAGPSLDKNIKYLKNAKGHAFIIAVDSAIRMCFKYDIVPDVIVTLDPDKERVLFENDKVNEIPMFFGTHATYDVVKQNRKKTILYNNMKFFYYFLNQMDVQTGLIDTGSSVANSAFSIARYLGFKDIIIIGQDLAFSGNKKHASDVYDDGGVNDKERNSGMYTTIEGLNGETLLTYKNFKVYRDWYERFIKNDKEVHLINATEGGALIHGADNMRLEDAINRFCVRDVDILKYIDMAPMMIPDDRKDEFDSCIQKSIDNLDELKAISEKCLAAYEEMAVCKDEARRKELAVKTDTYSKELYDYMEMEMVEYHARKVENIEASGIYDDTDVDIWEDTARRGINVVKAYLEGIKDTKEIFIECYKGL